MVHKAAEATGEYIRNEIADKIVKPKPVIHKNSRNFEAVVVPTQKIEEI